MRYISVLKTNNNNTENIPEITPYRKYPQEVTPDPRVLLLVLGSGIQRAAVERGFVPAVMTGRVAATPFDLWRRQLLEVGGKGVLGDGSFPAGSRAEPQWGSGGEAPRS